MPSLRSLTSKQKYAAYVRDLSADSTCSLCEKDSLKDFLYWKVVENSFPYDLIAKAHHMLIPIRHIHEAHLNNKELAELRSLKLGVLRAEYDYILENTFKNKSIPGHFHLHLLVGIPR